MEKLIINSKDIKHNIDTIKNYIQKNCNDNNVKVPKIIGVVKGNGYGLGQLQLANVVVDNGIDILAVSKVNDAIYLRQNGIKKDILFLSITTLKNDVINIIDNDIIPTIDSIVGLEIFNEIARKKNKIVNVHVKIETGFGRYGLKIDDVSKFIEIYNKCENVNIVGIFTHFSCAFKDDSKYTDMQYNKFMEVVKVFELNNIKPNMLHVCNSSAIFKYPKYYLDAVRTGSSISGRIPLKYKFGLKRVGYMETCISEVRELKRGNNIGYSNVYKLKKDSKIAICQVGYVEGVSLKVDSNVYKFFDVLRCIKHLFVNYFKKAKNYVLINNEKYEIISNIGMSNIIIDVSNSNVKTGDTVRINVDPILVDSNIKREYI